MDISFADRRLERLCSGAVSFRSLSTGASDKAFEPANDPVPRHGGGSVAWAQVNAVRIVFIGDYHD